MPRLLSTLVLLALCSSARAGDVLAGLRARDPDARRQAIDALLADPGALGEEEFGKARRVLLDLLEGDPRPEVRGLAARALATRRTTESDVRTVERLGREDDWRAQRPMLDALAGCRDEAVLALLVRRAFGDPRLDVRALWVEALGRLDHPRAAETLRSLAGAPLDWPVAIAAALALSRHAHPESVRRLIDLLWSDDDGVRTAAHESLVALTGERALPAKPGPWAEWWERRKEGFVFPGPPAPGEVVATVPAEPATVPTYYDIPIRGRRVVFCLDVSASMWGMKSEAASRELERAVRSLPSFCRFAVIFFNEHPLPWREEMTPAYPFQKLACVATFAGLETKKYTNIFDTLERALGFAGLGRYALPDPPGVDDVFLLTDGEPNRGRYRDTDGILAGLRELDPRGSVRIHTVSVGEKPRALLELIAKEHGGRHAHVEAAK